MLSAEACSGVGKRKSSCAEDLLDLLLLAVFSCIHLGGKGRASCFLAEPGVGWSERKDSSQTAVVPEVC